MGNWLSLYRGENEVKLKHYLTLTYLLVLIAPILCVGIGVKLNIEYNNRTKVKDYLATTLEFFQYEEIVSDPELYRGASITTALRGIALNEEVVITLYDEKGTTIYSSAPDNEYKLSVESLYKNLNEIQYGYNTYTLKKPVFDTEEQIIGFYEISIERENLKKEMQKNTMVTVGIFCFFVALIYIVILRRLHVRFSSPLQRVSRCMNEYAKGDNNVYIDYKANDEIGELCKHFNGMKEEIEESKQAILEEQKAKEYMIATISHDLKTPLTTVRAYTEMLKLGNITEEEKKEAYLETILSKCDYMRDMLDDLLTYNLLSMNYQLVRVEVEGEEFCEMLFSGIEATCKTKGITLEIDNKAHGNYKVDVKYMTRVIDNIVSNAIRHTSSGNRIWLGAFSTDESLPDWVDEPCKEILKDYVCPGLFLIVKNEGKAILQKDRENLFKPFYQGDEARSKKEHRGVGLGLSISKMIIEKHKGAIDVIPIEGVGNIMFCYLKSTSCKEEE